MRYECNCSHGRRGFAEETIRSIRCLSRCSSCSASAICGTGPSALFSSKCIQGKPGKSSHLSAASCRSVGIACFGLALAADPEGVVPLRRNCMRTARAGLSVNGMGCLRHRFVGASDALSSASSARAAGSIGPEHGCFWQAHFSPRESAQHPFAGSVIQQHPSQYLLFAKPMRLKHRFAGMPARPACSRRTTR
jgi:hypothetical protein